MQQLVEEIRKCTFCQDKLPLTPNPLFTASTQASIMVVGQAPGIRAHTSGKPWNDASGKRLREWLGVSETVFYDPEQIALVPMGLCYPGKGKNGDLPPRKECAPLWHSKLVNAMPNLRLTVLVGKYAQQYYLKDQMKNNLTGTVMHYRAYLPRYFPIVHPSPNTRFWLSKNPWFVEEVVPNLQEIVKAVLV